MSNTENKNAVNAVRKITPGEFVRFFFSGEGRNRIKYIYCRGVLRGETILTQSSKGALNYDMLQYKCI